MSDLANPYQSPENASVPEKTLGSQGLLTDTMLRYLKEADPWLRFAGIIGFFGAGFAVLACIIMAVVVGIMSAQGGMDVEGFPLGAFSLIYVIFGLIAGVISFFPAYFIFAFGKGIHNYFLNNAEQELEKAFKNNKSLWKFRGILCIISLAFIPLTIVLSIVGGIAAVLGGFFG
jgi:hypothetical protein